MAIIPEIKELLKSAALAERADDTTKLQGIVNKFSSNEMKSFRGMLPPMHEMDAMGVKTPWGQAPVSNSPRIKKPTPKNAQPKPKSRMIQSDPTKNRMIVGYNVPGAKAGETLSDRIDRFGGRPNPDNMGKDMVQFRDELYGDKFMKRTERIGESILKAKGSVMEAAAKNPGDFSAHYKDLFSNKTVAGNTAMLERGAIHKAGSLPSREALVSFGLESSFSSMGKEIESVGGDFSKLKAVREAGEKAGLPGYQSAVKSNGPVQSKPAMSGFARVKERGAFGKMMDSVSSKAKGLFERKEISETGRERSMLGRLKEGRASNKKIDRFRSKSSNMEGFKRLHSGVSLDPKDVGQAFDQAKGFVKEKLGRKQTPTSIANMSDSRPGLSSNTAMYPNIEGAKEMGPGLFGEGPKVMYPEVKGGKSKGSSLFGEKSTKMNEIRAGRNPLGATSVDDMFSSKIERGAYKMLDPERRADAVQGAGKLLGKGNKLLRGASNKLSQQGVLGQIASAAMAPLEIATNIGSKVMGSDWMYQNIHNNASRSRMSDTKMIGSASRGLKNAAGFSKKAGMGAAGILGKAAKMGARNPLAVGAAALIAGVAGSALGDLENTSVGPREASGLQKLGGPVGLATMAYMSSRDQTSNMKGADLAKSMSQPNKPDGPMSFGGGGSSMGGGRNYNMGATGDMALSLNSLRRGR